MAVISITLVDRHIIFQLVVLKDPNEDQDDVLRANRSREKQYIFDCAFGPNSSQVSLIMTYLFIWNQQSDSFCFVL